MSSEEPNPNPSSLAARGAGEPSTDETQEEDITIELPGNTIATELPRYDPVDLGDGSTRISMSKTLDVANHPSLHKTVSGEQLAKTKERLTRSAFSFTDVDVKVKDESE